MIMHRITYILILMLIIGCTTSDSGDDEDITSMAIAQSSRRNELIAQYGLTADQTINISGVTREYHILVPDNHVNAPIVFLFHGLGGDFNSLIGLFGNSAPFRVWIDIAHQEEIILVIPNGLYTLFLRRGWNSCIGEPPVNQGKDDVQFISALIDRIVNNYQADGDRVYANGTSNGGFLSIKLAREIPDKITAFASMLATHAVNSTCESSDVPVSALFMNGTADPIVAYEGGTVMNGNVELYSTEETIDYWVSRNGTDTSPEKSGFTDLDINDSSTVERYTYRNGINGSEVVLYKVIGGGHANPSRLERYNSIEISKRGNQNGDIEMADEVWNFFKDKTK